MGSSTSDIEAELKASRADLADTVSALEYKLDVPARAQERAVAAKATLAARWKPIAAGVGALVVAGGAAFAAKHEIDRRREDRHVRSAKRAVKQARALLDRVDTDAMRGQAQHAAKLGKLYGKHAKAQAEVAGTRTSKLASVLGAVAKATAADASRQAQTKAKHAKKTAQKSDLADTLRDLVKDLF